MTETVLDALEARLLGVSDFNKNAEEAPVAVLWPDEKGEWTSVADLLRDRLPLLQLGDFSVADRSGPSYWIRCAVARTVEVSVSTGVPIVYLPGFARPDLRAIESCPPELAPLAELQYRANWFSHPNGKDWSFRAFCIHRERGLGLQIPDDAETAESLLNSMNEFLQQPLERLANQQLDADFFHSLINPDPVQNLLDWLDDPEAFRERVGDERWNAFVKQSKASQGFDPMSDGPLVAAEKLGRREPGWQQVWDRFRETPHRYPGIPERLQNAKPMELVLESRDAWPQDDKAEEDKLRSELLGLGALTTEGARAQLQQLEEEHQWRRGTVWAELEQAPLAFALEQLSRLAEVTAKPLSAATLEALVADYVKRGWLADDAALRALAAVPDAADRKSASAAIIATYRPWLDTGARSMQAVIGESPDSYAVPPPSGKANGTVSLFVDGLRFDIAERVRERLEAGGAEVVADTVLAALPTVTPTAKAAVVPVAEGSLHGGPAFNAANANTGTKASIEVLRALLKANAVQVLSIGETGDPGGAGWSEVGDIDRLGHEFDLRLVDEVDKEVGRIVSRAQELLEAGWKSVEIKTDHGWLLIPGGMERVDLPAAVAEVKKGRCARVKEGANTTAQTVPWYWDPDVRMAVAPGASCFEANKIYEHGGVSPQECVLQRLIVSAGEHQALSELPQITSVKWLGLQCRIELEHVDYGIELDIRASPADASTSVAEKSRETSTSGRVSLIVPDEDLQNEAAFVVVLSAEGQLLAQREVTIGSNR